MGVRRGLTFKKALSDGRRTSDASEKIQENWSRQQSDRPPANQSVAYRSTSGLPPLGDAARFRRSVHLTIMWRRGVAGTRSPFE